MHTLASNLAVVDDNVKEGVHEQNTIRKNATCIQQHRLNIYHSRWSTTTIAMAKHGNKNNQKWNQFLMIPPLYGTEIDINIINIMFSVHVKLSENYHCGVTQYDTFEVSKLNRLEVKIWRSFSLYKNKQWLQKSHKYCFP